MNPVKFLIQVTACILLFSTSALAQDLGLVIGARNDNAETTVAGASIEGRTNLQAGMVAKFEISGPLNLRTGMIYVQRSYGTTVSGVSAGDTKASYLEIPFGAMYKFSDYGGAFVGAAIGLNVSKDCPGGCSGASVNSSPLAIQLGGSFKVHPQFGFEFYYETLTAKFANNIESPKAIVANVMIAFD